MTFCHVCWKNKGYELGSFSRLRMPDAFSFFCMSTEFQPHVFFETNRKQTTNLYKSVFDVFERSAILVLKKQQQFFLPWNVKGHSNRDVCAPAHFSSQGGSKEPSLVQIGVKATGQETSSDFVVSFGSLEQKLELERRTVCLSGRFFWLCCWVFRPCCRPRGFALSRVGNLGL